MAQGKLTDLVDDKAFSQIEKLISQMEVAKQSFVDTAAAAVTMNNAIASSKNFSQFNESAGNAASQIDQLAASQQKLAGIQSTLKNETAQLVEATKAKALADVDAQKVLQQIAGTLDQNIKLLVQQKIELAEVKEQQKLLSKEVVVSKEAHDRLTETKVRLVKTELELKNAISQNNTFIKQQVREANAAETSQEALRASVNQLRQAYDQLSASEREAMQGQIMLKEIQSLDAQIKRTAESTGKFNDSIGNYEKGALAAASSTEKAGRSIDVMGRLTNVLTNRVFRMAASFLLITVALGALEFIYKWVSAMDMFTGRLDEAIQKLKALKGALEGSEYATAIKNVSELTENIKLAKEGFLDKQKVLNEYNNTLGATIGYTDDLDTAEKLLVKNGEAYIKMTLLKAAAQLALQKSAKATAEAAEIQAKPTEQFGLLDRLFPTANKSPEELKQSQANLRAAQKADQDAQIADKKKEADLQLGIFKQFQEDAAKIAKANGFDFFDGTQDNKKGPKGPKDKTIDEEVELLKIKLENIKKYNKAIVDDDNISYGVRLDSLKRYLEAARQLIELERTTANKKPGITKKGVEINNERAKGQNTDVDLEEQQDTKRIFDKMNEDITKMASEEEKKQIDGVKRANLEKIEAINNNYDLLKENLVKQYTDRKVSEKEFNKQMLELDHQALQERIKVEIDGLKVLIGIKKALGESTIEDERRVVELEKQLSSDKLNFDIKTTKTAEDKRKELRDTEIQLLNETLDTTKTVVDAIVAIQEQRFQREKELMEQRFSDERMQIEQGVGTQRDKARRLNLIERQAQDERIAMMHKEAQIKRKAAIVDRTTSINKIIENTAVGISGVWANPGYPWAIPLSILVGVLGAAQIASVAATPIPQYAKGTQSAPGGLAWVGEKGSELMVEPGGKTSLTPGTATLMNLKRGTKIIPHHDVIQMIANKDTVVNNEINLDKLIDAQKETTQAIKTLNRQSKRSTGLSSNNAEWNEYLRRNKVA